MATVMLFLGVGLSSSGDPSINCSCWHVGLAVGLSLGGCWSRLKSGVGGWVGLEVGVELNSRGEGLQLPESQLFVRGMQGITERNSLNRLFGISYVVLTLSSCVWGGSDSISRGVSGVHSSM